MGLVAKVQDVSQQTHYYVNAVVSAELDSRDDPLHRLVRAQQSLHQAMHATGDAEKSIFTPGMGAATREYERSRELSQAELEVMTSGPFAAAAWGAKSSVSKRVAEPPQAEAEVAIA